MKNLKDKFAAFKMSAKETSTVVGGNLVYHWTCEAEMPNGSLRMSKSATSQQCYSWCRSIGAVGCNPEPTI